MNNFEFDVEITNAIKNGHHNFNKIFEKIKKGSKITFSKHLDRLIEDGVIIKSKDKRPYFSLGDIETYEEIQNVINRIKRNASNIEKESKKYSDKKLLQNSVGTIINYLTHISLLTFHASITEYQTSRTAEIEMSKELLRYVKKIMKILEKRDLEFPVMCYNLVKKQMLKIEKK